MAPWEKNGGRNRMTRERKGTRRKQDRDEDETRLSYAKPPRRRNFHPACPLFCHAQSTRSGTKGVLSTNSLLTDLISYVRQEIKTSNLLINPYVNDLVLLPVTVILQTAY